MKDKTEVFQTRRSGFLWRMLALSLVAFLLVPTGRAEPLDNLAGPRFISIAAGEAHSLALKPDGTVVAWGSNGYGQTTVPKELNGVTSIAGGGVHSLALRLDGTVVAWGDNQSLQNRVLDGLNGVVAIAAGHAHSVALKVDGTVVAWGSNQYGESTVPEGLSNVIAVAAGGAKTLALRSNGTVAAWGFNFNGASTPPAGLNSVIAIGVGEAHYLALRSDGTVVVWGETYGWSTPPPGLSGVVAIAAGGLHNLAIKNDGTVVAWGDNRSEENTLPIGLTGVTGIAAGDAYNLALKSDGSVVGWGDNSAGQLPNPAIFLEPISQESLVGKVVSFNVSAGGLPPLTYQWRKNGVAINGATNPEYTIPMTQVNDTAAYSVEVSNTYGSATSVAANLQVAPIVEVGSYPADRRVEYLSVQIAGKLAYVAGGDAGLIVLDVSNPADPTIAGVDSTTTAEGLLQVSEGRVYYMSRLDNGPALQIAEVDASGKPRRIGMYKTGEVWDLAIAGGYAYLGGEGGLQIVDVRNPAAPVLKTVWGRNVWAIEVKGDRGYVADGNVLSVLDLTDPTTPLVKGSLPLRGVQMKIALGNRYAYTTSGGNTGRLDVVDIHDPDHLVLAGSLAVSGWVRGLAIDGSKLSLVNSSDYSVTFLDVSDPSNPRMVSQYKTLDPSGVASVSGLTGIASIEEGVEFLDTTDPAKPKRIGRYLPPAFLGAAAVDSNHYYVLNTEHLWAFDVSDPKAPRQLSTYDITPSFGGYSPNDVKIKEGYGYLLGEGGGVRIVDLRDPQHPTSAGSYGTQYTYQAMAIGGTQGALIRAISSDPAVDWQVELVDLSVPAIPNKVGEYYPGGFVRALAYSGKLLFLTGEFGLRILDVSNPAAPKLVSQYGPDQDAPSGFNDVLVTGTTAYLVGGSFRILDVSDPAQPQLIGEAYGTGGNSLTISGTRAWLSAPDLCDSYCIPGGVQVLDISNPMAPKPIGSGLAPVSGNHRVTQVQDFMYILANGFLITQLSEAEARSILQMQKAEGGVQVSWSSDFGDYKLQETTTAANSSSWIDVLTAPAAVNGNLVLPLPASDGQRFYRLIKR